MLSPHPFFPHQSFSVIPYFKGKRVDNNPASSAQTFMRSLTRTLRMKKMLLPSIRISFENQKIL